MNIRPNPRFRPSILIAILLADPKTAGDVSGAGVFQTGTSVTVSAEPRPGYVFIEWTEAGNPVSTDASYTFTSVAPRNLTARFVVLPTLTAAPGPAPGQMVLTWPDVPNWVLKESLDLTTWNTTTRTITTLNGQKSVTVNASERRGFFRLLYQ
jgi:Divergent InlB B-repeat domain